MNGESFNYANEKGNAHDKLDSDPPVNYDHDIREKAKDKKIRIPIQDKILSVCILIVILVVSLSGCTKTELTEKQMLSIKYGMTKKVTVDIKINYPSGGSVAKF